MAITAKNFQILTDINLAWQVMTNSCTPLGQGGMPAPFFEYAITSSWMDKRYVHLNRFWMDGEKPVGFVFYESPVTMIFFSLIPGYEYLSKELISYADRSMPGEPGRKEFVLFPGQTALIEEAKKLGYKVSWVQEDKLCDFEKTTLDFALPSGFHFVKPEDIDPVKLSECCWKGFDHEDKGAFVDWDKIDVSFSDEWTPSKSYQDVISSFLAPPPHATYELGVVISDEAGEYACFSGMWFVKENALAYMEPLCTIPKYRGMGLAKAALSMHYKTLKPLGAKIMTGGENDFYRKIGYTEVFRWIHLKKDK